MAARLGGVRALVQDAQSTEFLKRQETVGVIGFLLLARARTDNKRLGEGQPVRVCDLDPGA